VKNRKTTKRE